MRQKELLVITVTVFLTIVAWIVSDLYHIAQTEKIGQIKSKRQSPLNIKINVEVFDRLEKKG